MLKIPVRFKFIIKSTLGIFYMNSLLITTKACKKICFSCTNMAENEKCTHAITCEDNEVCFVQKYQTTENNTRYDVGCTLPQLCRKDISGNIFGKRSDHSHVICQKCCDENVCNTNMTCMHELKVHMQKCLTCSEVEDPVLCKNTTLCGKDELCPRGYAIEFGRRSSAGRHFLCESCCSGSDLCNHDLMCGHNQQKSINATCSSTVECADTLFCIHRKCKCDLEVETWNGNACSKKKSLNSSCSVTYECASNLVCLSEQCQCVSSDYWSGEVCMKKPKECMDIIFTQEGIFTIYPNGINPVLVYCIIDGKKKWTVIQRRFNKSVDFYRTWSEYKTGFGNLNGEYWLGNENIHLISTDGHHEISIYMESAVNGSRFANYSTFSVGNEASKYILNITGYSGDAGDSMDNTPTRRGEGANGQMFSTKDQDNDKHYYISVANGFASGWWYYGSWVYSDLNSMTHGMVWISIPIDSIKKSVMMIRRT